MTTHIVFLSPCDPFLVLVLVLVLVQIDFEEFRDWWHAAKEKNSSLVVRPYAHTHMPTRHMRTRHMRTRHMLVARRAMPLPVL